MNEIDIRYEKNFRLEESTKSGIKLVDANKTLGSALFCYLSGKHLRSLARQRLYWLKFLRNSKLKFATVCVGDKSEKILCRFHPKKFSAVHSAFPFTLLCVRECRSAMRTWWQLFGCHSRRTPWYLCFSAVHVTDWLWFACATFSSTWLVFRHCRTPNVTGLGDINIHVLNYNADYRSPSKCQGVGFEKRDWKIDFSRDENLSQPKSWQKINKSRGLMGIVCRKWQKTFFCQQLSYFIRFFQHLQFV